MDYELQQAGILFACMQVQQVHDKSDKSRWYMKHDFSAV
jgi:hypothetical protein